MEYTDRTYDKKLIVMIGGIRYSLPVSGVERVVSLQRDSISSVPYDRSGRIAGIFDQGGLVTAIAETGLKANLPDNADGMLTLVILRDGSRRFAVLVDSAETTAEKDDVVDAIPLSVNALYYGGSDSNDQ